MRRTGEPKLYKARPVERPTAVLEEAPEAFFDPFAAGPPELPMPGAFVVNPLLDPIPNLFPAGVTDFQYLYEQIGGVASDLSALSLGAGAQTFVQNLFTTNQTINVINAGIGDEVLRLDIENNSTGVSYPLVIRHRYLGGVGPIGLGVGIDLGVESGVNNASFSIASFEAQSVDNTSGSMDGEAGINVAVNGVGTRIVSIRDQNVRVVRDPLASASQALLGLGNGSLVGSAAGTHLAFRGQAGFTGNFIDAQAAGVRRFSVGGSGRTAVVGDPTAVQVLSQPLSNHLFHVSDPIPAADPVELSFTKHPNANSGLVGLHLSQASDHNQPIGISLDLDGVPLWDGFALDFDKTVGGDPLNTDFVVVLSHRIGGDILRFSHRPLGSGGAKMIFGQGIGTPAGEANAFTLVGDTGVGGQEIRVNSATAQHLVLTQMDGTYRTKISFHGRYQMGTDFAGAATNTWYLRDLQANAHRIFMDASGNVVMGGGSNNPRGLFNLFAAPTASGQYGLLSLGGGGFTGGAGHFSGDAQGTVVAGNVAAGYTGNLIDMQVGGVSKFRADENGTVYVNGVAITGGGDAFIGSSNAWSAAQTFAVNDANATGVTATVRARHTTSGAAAAGIGAGIGFDTEDNAGAAVEVGSIQAVMTDVNSVARSSKLTFTAYGAGSAQTPVSIFPDHTTISGNPAANASYGLLSLGGDFTGGVNPFGGSAQGTLLAGNMDPGTTRDWLNFQMAGSAGLIAKIAASGATEHQAWDASATGPIVAMTLRHKLTTGTPTTGFGVTLQMEGPDANGVVRQYGNITADLRDATAGAVGADMVFSISDAGSIAEIMRLRASTRDVEVIERVLAQAGLGVGNAVSKTTLAAPGTVIRSIELYDAFTGASIGSVPVYANGSFS